MLEAVGVALDDGLASAWRGNVARARRHLGWAEDAACAVRRHASGVSLALAAPLDGLFTATELNEWALCAALHDRDPARWGGLRDALRAAAEQSSATPASPFPAEIDEPAALARLSRVAAREQRPGLVALVDEARSRGCQVLFDDQSLTLGAGATGCSFDLAKLPSVADVTWRDLRPVPTALVTGSNGKTTTVRLIAACTQAQGWRAGYSSTDGVFVAGAMLESGDYSGPAGARRVLRDERVEAAVLETARGGILRRGLAVLRADVAVVTNVSADHFGEYGIHDLDALADVKLTVGSVVPEDGLLVLNADDSMLRTRAVGLARRFGRCPPLGWFAADADDPSLAAHRQDGGSTCGVRSGRLVVAHRGAEHDLGEIVRMPLTVGGRASYNVANLAAAALAAVGLGVPAARVAEVFARFGEHITDNPGRMMRFERNGTHVLVDYAHNPEGLAGLLDVAISLRGGDGRLGVVLGHAGNRGDRDIERLAETAAQFAPALVVIKELEGYLRGREPGEVPGILRTALLRAGLPVEALEMQSTELDAVRCALEWGRPGDVLALPVHGLAARAAVLELLQA